MSYMIDSGIWSSVFAVPASVVDDHIRMCSPLSLKILLVMLRHPGVPVDAGWLSAQLNISPADITDALGYWIGAGIVSDSNRPAVPAPARPEPSAQAPAPAASAPAVVSERKNTETGQKLVTISSRPKISREDIAELSSANPTIGQLLQEAQQVLGAPLTPVESEILTALCSYYGLHPDVVLMLLQYCVSIGHKSMNFVEKTAASWIELGITTHEQVEQEIVRLTRDNENESKIVRAFQLYGRGLTSKEKEYVVRPRPGRKNPLSRLRAVGRKYRESLFCLCGQASYLLEIQRGFHHQGRAGRSECGYLPFVCGAEQVRPDRRRFLDRHVQAARDAAQ